MNPVSLPVVPAPPANMAEYSLNALDLFAVFNRASFFAKFGIQAPNWDPKKPVKGWLDTSPATAGTMKSYTVVTSFMTGTFGSITMSPEDAAAVNIPGLQTYPAYSVDPTAATMNGDPNTPIDPKTLSNYGDAVALAGLWGLSTASVFDGDWTVGPMAIKYPPQESRRQWYIAVNGQAVNAGVSLAEMYANGVGAPGTWSLGTGEPVWTSAPSGEDGIHTGVREDSVPVPVRLLLPTESIIQGLFGAQVKNSAVAG